MRNNSQMLQRCPSERNMSHVERPPTAQAEGFHILLTTRAYRILSPTGTAKNSYPNLGRDIHMYVQKRTWVIKQSVPNQILSQKHISNNKTRPEKVRSQVPRNRQYRNMYTQFATISRHMRGIRNNTEGICAYVQIKSW